MSKGKHFADKKTTNLIDLEEKISIKRRKKKEKNKNRKKEKCRKLFLKIFIVLFLVSLIYLINAFWYSIKEEQETDELLNKIEIDSEIIEETKESKNEMVEKVKTLKQQYSDVIGWIEIDGTNINYPVMQCEDNDFYMTHDYKKEESKRGSLFLDKDYDWTIPSSNLLIYGHNNTKDGSMFADLLKYKERKFYEEHPTIKFVTDKEEAEYEIIAAFLSRVYYKSETNVFRYYYFINAENEEEYNNYIINAKEASLYNTGKTAKYGDQLITLSTCEYSQEDGRFVVVARKK